MSFDIAPSKIASLLRELLGRPVDFDTASAPDFNDHAPRWAAAYGTAEGGLMVVCVCDLAFAAFAGAALSMIPAPIAKEGIGTRQLEPAIIDNRHYIFDMIGQLLRGRMRDTVTLLEVSRGPELTPLARALLAKPTRKLL